MNYKTKLRFAPLALAMLLLLFSLGCALPSPVPVEDGSVVQTEPTYDNTTENQTYLIDIIDMAGNPVQMNSYAGSIVVLDPGDCEILCAIGAEEQIIGRSEDCDYPESVASLPVVTTEGMANTEQILTLNPQAVVMDAEAATDTSLIAELKEANITPIVTNVTDIKGLYTAITLLGTVTDRVAESGSVVANLLAAFAGIQAKVTDNTSKTIYFELAPLATGLETAGSGTLINDISLLLGYHNEFEDMEGFIPVTAAQVIGRSPDVIVTTIPSSEDGTAGVSEILARVGWESVQAIADKKVFYIDGELLSRPGPRLLDVVNALYTFLYETPAE